MAHSSQEEGNALADVLFGTTSWRAFSANLAKSLDQIPEMLDYNIRDGRTYMYFKGVPLYPLASV